MLIWQAPSPGFEPQHYTKIDKVAPTCNSIPLWRWRGQSTGSSRPSLSHPRTHNALSRGGGGRKGGKKENTVTKRKASLGLHCDSLINSLALMFKIQGAHSPFSALRTRTENTQACLPACLPACLRLSTSLGSACWFFLCFICGSAAIP